MLFSDLIESRWEKVNGELDASLRGHFDRSGKVAGLALEPTRTTRGQRSRSA